MKTTSKAILNAAFALLCGITVLACSEGKTNNKGAGGAAGTAAGTGGSGGSAGGGSNMRCAAGATVAAGDKPMVDNFEDGDLIIIHPETGTEDGRGAETALLFDAKDTTAMLVPTGTELHFTANPNMQWPSFGIPIATCYDASAYAGVSFKIKGTAKDGGGKDIPNPLKFGVATPPSTPEPAGTCPCPDTDVCAQCYDSFGLFLPSLNATDYQTVTVLWGQLKQGTWGHLAPAGYDPAKEVMELDWGVGVNVGAFDIYLDDVSFIQK